MNNAHKASATEESIKARAYALWEDEGRPEGKHLEHWRRAAEEGVASEEPAAAAPSNGAKPPVRRASKAKSPQSSKRGPAS